jgi:hypothetical protein
VDHGPPKQSVRFQPEKFDVDANLYAPPLATYGAQIGADIDRGRIAGNKLGISAINKFEQDVHQDLKKVEGYDQGDPLSLVIEAKAIMELDPLEPDAVTKLKHSEEDLSIRDRIWRLRSGPEPEILSQIGSDLSVLGLGDYAGGILKIQAPPLTLTKSYK